MASNVPNTSPVGDRVVPNTSPGEKVVPSTRPSAKTKAAKAAAVAATDDAVWPPLGAQADGTVVWQYSPEWVKSLWSIDEPAPDSIDLRTVSPA